MVRLLLSCRRGPRRHAASRSVCTVRRCARALLLVEPDSGQILIEVMARGYLPALDVRAVGDDPVPPQRDEIVRLAVEHPLLVGADDPLLLGDVAGAVH